MILKAYKKLNVFLYAFVVFFACFIGQSLAIEYGGIGGRPAYPRADNPRTQSIFVHTVMPGQVVDEGVTVINNTSERKTISVFGVDSIVSSGGSFACAQQADKQIEAGNWISLTKSTVTIDSLKSEIIPFKIKVPQDASTGEHNACIVIQEVKPPSESGASGVLLSFRTGMRIALTVPGEIKREIKVSGFSLTKKDDGGILLHPQVKNTGNVSIDTDVSVTTKYFFGRNLITQKAEFPVLREQTSNWNFEVSKPFWGGFYNSTFVVGYYTGLDATVGVKANSKQEMLQGGTIWFFSPPSSLALSIEISVFVLIILVMLLVYRNYKYGKSVHKNWVSYVVKPGEDIKLISEKCGVSWKKLASINSIKPPYLLSQGLIIKIPPQIKNSISSNKKSL